MKLKGTITGFYTGGEGDSEVDVAIDVSGKVFSNKDEVVTASIRIRCSRGTVKDYALGDIFEVDISQLKP